MDSGVSRSKRRVHARGAFLSTLLPSHTGEEHDISGYGIPLFILFSTVQLVVMMTMVQGLDAVFR